MTEPLGRKSRLHISLDQQRDTGADNAPAVIAISAGAISGFIMGLLVRGEFITSAFVLLAACICAVIGWWARGVQ